MTRSEPSRSSDRPAVELHVESADNLSRRREPVTCGVPWPRGALPDASRLVLTGQQGNAVPLQARVLDRWSDGSVRWVLLDWQADVSGSARYFASSMGENDPPPLMPVAPMRVTCEGGVADVDTGAARFRLRAGGPFPFEAVAVNGVASLDPDRSGFAVEDGDGRAYRPRVDTVLAEEAGPLRACVRLDGLLVGGRVEPLGEFTARLHFFAGSPTVRFHITLRNPRKADHPGGIWVLGSGGSVYLRDASLCLSLPAGPGPVVLRCSPETGSPFERFPAAVELYQDSSGGPNWDSHNHVNRRGVVPNTFRGYRLRAGGQERARLRATPVVAVERGPHTLALAVQYFWQNFPKAVEVSPDGIVLRLFPRQYADLHELQGGEQKTHTFSVAFGPDVVTDEPLDWCRSPLRAGATPEWYCAAGVVPHLTPRASDPNAEYLRLVDAAVGGGDTFAHKREVIDEYGWRNFGDLYADHEAVSHRGPAPLVSHYNNQYDAVAGFAWQFLRSGDWRWWQLMDELAAHVADIDVYHTDRDKAAYNHGLFWHTFHYVDAGTSTHRDWRWWQLMDELAAHVADIDVYHTDRDKAAYNHGLFWHTFHYVDAGTSTHRSYPRAPGVGGGGPSGEHNYATGLMLHHFLTGNAASGEAAVGLARWVIDLDDGRKTVFRWLDRGDTGWASSSRTPSYHGPGRGAGNSVAALLAGHQLTGEAAFLAKAEQLIRRCIHPHDDLAARNLLDAENRWFYTVFLQALGRYLDYKAERGSPDATYAYAQASLLHYARWMAEHEYPYLDKPEILEYPTETWPAQDLRKCEVLDYAALHAAGPEKARFLERAEFFFRYSTSTLSEMKSRTLTRPVVLLLTNGFRHAAFRRDPGASAPAPAAAERDFGRPAAFVPQKVRAKRRLLALAAAGLAAAAALAALLLTHAGMP